MPQDFEATVPSFWLADSGDPLEPRPGLEGDISVDVAIVGAGYTGLWTAWYLTQHAPSLQIAVLEARAAGFGASGRNGGWCNAHLEGVETWLAGRKREAAIALQRDMFDTVDEVGRVAAKEGIDCDYVKSGYLTVATNEAQRARGLALVEALQAPGFGEADYRWLDADACNERVRFAGARGGVYSPHCATVQPAKLVRGLARAVERRGVTIYERTPARAIGPGGIQTRRGAVRAEVVLRCTEGYTHTLRGERRSLMPMHTMMVVTDPLSEEIWDTIGARDRLVFGDACRLLGYAQRTKEGRLAFGAGGRYFFRSALHDPLPEAGGAYTHTEDALRTYFPALREVSIAQRWAGAFGVPRDWKPFVRFDAQKGVGAAGGYVGSGVAASNLAGRTLADLVLRRDTQRTRHPWVQHRTPRWEPEPLRYVAVNAVLKMAAAADRADRNDRPSRLRAAIFHALTHR